MILSKELVLLFWSAELVSNGILPALDQKLQVLKMHRNQGNHGHQPDQANVRLASL